jgi:hypothetical protein
MSYVKLDFSKLAAFIYTHNLKIDSDERVKRHLTLKRSLYGCFLYSSLFLYDYNLSYVHNSW